MYKGVVSCVEIRNTYNNFQDKVKACALDLTKITLYQLVFVIIN